MLRHNFQSLFLSLTLLAPLVPLCAEDFWSIDPDRTRRVNLRDNKHILLPTRRPDFLCGGSTATTAAATTVNTGSSESSESSISLLSLPLLLLLLHAVPEGPPRDNTMNPALTWLGSVASAPKKFGQAWNGIFEARGNANSISSSESTTREEDVFVGKRMNARGRPVSEEDWVARDDSRSSIRSRFRRKHNFGQAWNGIIETCGNAKISRSESTTREEDVFVRKSKRMEARGNLVGEEYWAALIRSNPSSDPASLRGWI